MENLDFHGDDAGVDHVELLGDADGDVDDAAADEGAAVGDTDDLGASVSEVGDEDVGAHGKGAVGGGLGAVAEGFAARGGAAAVGADGIPGGLSGGNPPGGLKPMAVHGVEVRGACWSRFGGAGCAEEEGGKGDAKGGGCRVEFHLFVVGVEEESGKALGRVGTVFKVELSSGCRC